MKVNPKCPICDCSEWKVIGIKIYDKNNASQLNSYAKLRYRVLFEVWLPGEIKVEMKSVLCLKCGFVTYIPRPTSTDVNQKYSFLSKHPDSNSERSVTLESDSRRSTELLAAISPYLNDKPAKVLGAYSKSITN